METDPSSLLQLLQTHLGWYPQMELGDVYKLIYQGAMGPEHLVATRQEFARRLVAELEIIQPDPEQHLLEPVRTDQSLYRVNLRAYKSRSHEIERLLSLLLQTSKLASSEKADLLMTWAVFVHLCEQGELGVFEVLEVDKFSRWLKQEDYPIIHHSEAYHRLYQPAYRLVGAQFVLELGMSEA
jgi:hypothetical protein